MTRNERKSEYLKAALQAFLDTNGEYNISRTAELAKKSNSSVRNNFGTRERMREQIVSIVFKKLNEYIDYVMSDKVRPFQFEDKNVIDIQHFNKAYVLMLSFPPDSVEYIKARQYRLRRLAAMEQRLRADDVLDSLSYKK